MSIKVREPLEYEKLVVLVVSNYFPKFGKFKCNRND